MIPEVARALGDLVDGANHVDVVTVEGERRLRQFLAAMLAWQPGWVTLLFRVRRRLVTFIGLHQGGMPRAPRFTPEQVPMRAGEPASFFTVLRAEEERLWVAEVEESHLRARLCVVVDDTQRRRFHVVTVVHYKSWAGPVYFNAIRPFHHLVVGGMARAGLGEAG